jgi:hypothetical protein
VCRGRGGDVLVCGEEVRGGEGKGVFFYKGLFA